MNLNTEVEIKEGDILVSTTDKRGVITYANDLFLEVVGYKRAEVLGKPHNIVRHPDMPKTVFKILWDAVLKGDSVSAYVKNRVNGGGFYWVRAFVMPVMENGQIVRIVSYRRSISEKEKQVLTPLYQTLLDYERSHSVNESLAFFTEFLKERKLDYTSFLTRLATAKQITNVKALNIDVEKYLLDHIIFKATIISQKHAGEKVDVTQPCCCAFGEFIQANQSESFTRDSSWSKVINAHNAVHAHLTDYANGRVGESVLTDVDRDTQAIFENLQNVIDNTN